MSKNFVIRGVLVTLIVVSTIALVYVLSRSEGEDAPESYKINMDTLQVEILSDENDLVSDLEEDVRLRYQSFVITLDQDKGLDINVNWYRDQIIQPMKYYAKADENVDTDSFGISVVVHDLVDLYHDLDGTIDLQANTIEITETYGSFDQISEIINRHQVRITAQLVEDN